MPWIVEKDLTVCPTEKPFAVKNQTTGDLVGCHVTKDVATKQQAALYADADKAKKEGGHMRSAPREGLVRSVPFEMTSDSRDGDGLTFDGYAAVFDSPTRIRDSVGEFDEVIRQGAFSGALAERTPVLMFEHGKHPLLGSMPLGVITRAEEDAKGLHIQARLSDNWLIQPVRDAVRDGAITGMSFRFSIPDGGDTWSSRKGGVDLREITRIGDLPEVGPVVFPAYEPTTASVRSLAARLDGTRQMAAEPDAVALAQAVDASLDAALAGCQAMDATPEMQDCCGLLVAAEAALDALLELLGAPEDEGAEMAAGRSKDLTGRRVLRMAGSDSTTPDGGPSDGGHGSPSKQARTRDRVLHMKGIL
jgi:HK97 family phage prohead protease